MTNQQDKKIMLLRFGLIQGGALFLAGGATIIFKPDLLGIDPETAKILGPVLCLVGLIDFGMAWFLPMLMNKGKQ